MLLQVNIDSNDQEIFVGDAGFIEGYLYREDNLQIPDKYKIVNPEEAYRKYQESLIPIGEYLPSDHRYLVPEVQIRKPISTTELSICEIQPILEREIGNGNFSDLAIHPLPKIFKYSKELELWIKSMKDKAPFLESCLQKIAEKMSRSGPEI